MLFKADDLVRIERGRTWKESTERVAEIMKTAKTEGITESVKIFQYNGKKYIIDGHHRVEAARRLDIDFPVKYLKESELSEYSHTLSSVLQDASNAAESSFKVDGRKLQELLDE